MEHEEKERGLEQICFVEDFSNTLQGITYCSLSIVRKVECRWLSKEKDHNGLYSCENPLYSQETSNSTVH
jgi:hypothetical protein